MKKQLTVTAFITALILMIMPMSALAGWVKTYSGMKYQEGNTFVTGFYEVDGSYYYFDSYGIMQTGLVKDSEGTLYYFDKSTGEAEQGWISDGGYKYYAIDDEGELALGLTQIGSALYYFEEDGHMAQKTLVKNEADGYKYYLKKNGKAAKNRWVTYNKQSYYVDSNCRVVTNTYVNGKYVDAEGVLGGTATTSASASYSGQQSYASSSADSTTYSTTTSSASDVMSGEGADIAEYALQFVGNPYVYGGTSLTNGADCSGFVFTVFKDNGYSLLRTADEQMKGPSSSQIANGYSKGYSVPKSDLKPGDLVFYGASGYASHVAIYVGNDEVVHAVNSQQGIKRTSITHTGMPIKYMRYWE